MIGYGHVATGCSANGGCCTVATMSRAIEPVYNAPTPSRPISRYVSARSGLRNVEPTAGACPPGRYSALVELNCANALTLLTGWLSGIGSVIWLWNVASTANPRSATLAAGASDAARDRVPHRRSASCQVSRVPGTPTETPLIRACWNVYPAPVAGSTKAFSCIDIGAASRP